MTTRLKPRTEWTRQEIVTHALRSCALAVDPNGLLKSLADEINLHETTFSRWIAQGYVPWHRARFLQRKFGKSRVCASELCPAEYRRNAR